MREFRSSLLVFLMLTVVTGIIYPFVVTGVAKIAFPWQASGSLIQSNDKVIGSTLIGQSFSDPKYFWGRPSATSPQSYNAASSSGSNQGPTNPALAYAVKMRIETLRAADPGNSAPVPVDLVTASGSGLDPHISVAAAQYQIARIARVRGMPEDKVRELVAMHTEQRQLGVLGEPRVNVLQLNMELDKAK